MSDEPYTSIGGFDAAYNPTLDDVDSLGDMMQHVLDDIVGVFAQADVPVPDRRYIAIGGTVHDCEQLTVSFAQMYLGLPGTQVQATSRCDSPRSAALTVELVRCIPTIGSTGGRGHQQESPSPEDQTTAAKKQARDAWLLLAAGATSVDHFGLGTIADIGLTEPQGGYQAIVMNLVAAVP